MSGILFGVFYVALFGACGCLLARRLLQNSDLYLILPLGACFGTALLAALPALAALFFDFTLPAVACAGVVCLCICAGVVLRPCRLSTVHSLFVEKQDKIAFWAGVLPTVFLTCRLLCSHTLLPAADGSIYCGQSTFGDLPMHLSFITSLAENGTFPPSYPLLAGDVAMGYPFLCETVSSVLLLLGTPLRWACLLPQFMAVFAAVGCAFLLLRQLCGHAGKALLGFILFFFGSGFGIFYFTESKERFFSILTGFYTTPTNYLEENIRWVNPIADMMVPQRATLFGWAVLFGALWLLYRFAFLKEHRHWPALGALAGILTLLHTHSLLVLFFFSAALALRAAILCRFDFKQLRCWIFYALLAAALCLPLFLAFTLPQAQGGSFIQPWFNWVNHGTDPWLWFYIKNLGLLFLALPFAFFHADKDQKWFYAGALAIWAVSEVMLFQPNPYDNNKLLFLWFFAGCGLEGCLFWDLLAKIKPSALRRSAAALLLAVICAGSVMTLIREDVSRYQHFSAAEVSAAAWAKENTPADALFLTSDQHNNPIASLAGRQIFCGSGSYLYYHGVDYSAQSATQKQLYEAPTDALMQEWGVDYVLISGYERSDHNIDYAFFESRCTTVFTQGDVVLLKYTG